jgi:biofilm PGA synthesis N-glycosyltransferase PgaC
VVVNGLLMQLVMPFMIVGYTGVMLFTLPVGAVLGVLAFIYLAYLASLFLLFALCRGGVGAPRGRRGLPGFLPLDSTVRICQSCALLVLHPDRKSSMNSHLDSSMAPWWVLRKTKF